MAIGNDMYVELMHECFPKRSRMERGRMKNKETEDVKKRVSIEISKTGTKNEVKTA